MKKSWVVYGCFLRELKATERTGADSNLKIIKKHAPNAKSDIAVDSRLMGRPLGRNGRRILHGIKGIGIAVKIRLCDVHIFLHGYRKCPL